MPGTRTYFVLGLLEMIRSNVKMGTELTITAANRFYVQICIGCHVNTA